MCKSVWAIVPGFNLVFSRVSLIAVLSSLLLRIGLCLCRSSLPVIVCRIFVL